MATSKEIISSTGRIAGNIGSSIGPVVKKNLFPTLLLGAGLTWFIAQNVRKASKARDEEHWEGLRYDTLAGPPFASSAGESNREAWRRQAQQASANARRTRGSAPQASNSRQFMPARSLMIAGALLTVGSTLGFFLPSTIRKSRDRNHWRRNLMEAGRSTISEVKEVVQKKAAETLEEVKHKI